MTYPMRAFIKDSLEWHDIARFEMDDKDICLISTQKGKEFSLFGGEVQNIVISPDVLSEILESVQKTARSRTAKPVKKATDIETE